MKFKEGKFGFVHQHNSVMQRKESFGLTDSQSLLNSTVFLCGQVSGIANILL